MGQVQNGRAYVCTLGAGLRVFDNTNSSSPRSLGAYGSDIPAKAIWVQGGLVYIAADVLGVHVVDFADPANPRLLGTYETSGYTQGVALSKGHAFLADSWPAMRAVNVSNPREPRLADTSGGPNSSDIAIVGDYAYLRGTGGLGSVSVADPGNLIPAGTAGGGNSGTLLRGSGNYLYLPFADSECSTGSHPCFPLIYEGGFSIHEVFRFPGTPQFQGQYSISDRVSGRDVRAWDLTVAGNYVHVAHTDRLAVVDVGDPQAPWGVSELPLDCWRIAIAGDYAYVAGPIPYVQFPPPQTLSVINIRDKFGPVKVGEIATRGRLVNAMVVAGQHLYLSSSNLVEVFDLSDPANPVSVGSAATKGEGLDLAVEGNLIYVADGSWGLQIFQVDLIRLEAELAGTELRLRWPADASNYILQSTLTLTDPQWEPVAAPPQVQDGFNVVKLPANSPAAFFRLLRP